MIRFLEKHVDQGKAASWPWQLPGLLESVASKHSALTVAKKFIPVRR